MFNNTSPEPEESRIPTLRDSYNLIEKRLSFSFQKKNSGPRRWIKIIILLFAVGALTWYGKQASNNPFHPLHRIVIAGNNKTVSIYSYRKDSVLAILPLDLASPLPARYPLPKHWNCLSRTVSINHTLFPHPPKQWQIIDTTTPQKKIRTDWPSPRSFEKNGFSDCSIKSLYPFNDHRNFLNIVVSGIRIFIIDASEFIETSADTILLQQEASEILIIINADNRSALILRAALRPHFTIAFGNFKGTVPPYPNLLICGSAAIAEHFIFTIDLKRHVILESRRKSSPHSR